jgi:hypothetical protein
VTVTRDVILDLWPLYEAGELSKDSGALVDRFLESDPDFAGVLRRAGEATARALGRGSADAAVSERRMVQATRRRLARQRWLTGAAVLATLLPFSTAIDFSPRLDLRPLVLQWPILWVSLPIGLILWIWLWRAVKGGLKA